MVWGCMSAAGVGELVVIDGNYECREVHQHTLRQFGQKCPKIGH